jgi:hypothetical protein
MAASLNISVEFSAQLSLVEDEEEEQPWESGWRQRSSLFKQHSRGVAEPLVANRLVHCYGI